MSFLYRFIPGRLKNHIKNKIFSRHFNLSNDKNYNIIIDQHKLRERIAFVTGGSGSIGRSICHILASNGAKVYVGGTNEHKVNQVVDEIRKNSFEAFPLLIDLKNESSIIKAFSHIESCDNKLDIFVSSAGGSAREKSASLLELPSDVLMNTISINLIGTVLCCKHASKLMYRNRYGRIVCVGSIIGDHGKVNFSDYAASKGGLQSFCRCLSMELGKYSVTVNTVSPGIVQRGDINFDTYNSVIATNWLQGVCTPEDIANAVTFLCSDEARFITGQNLVVDGGRSLGLKGD